MSHREIAFNVMLGAILLLVFAVPVFLLVLAGALLVHAAHVISTQYLAHLPHSYGLGFALSVCLILAFYARAQIRERRWTNAFLFIVGIPVLLLDWFFTTSADLTQNFPSVYLLSFFLLTLVPIRRRLQHWELILGTALLASYIALREASGFSSYADGALFLAVILWLMVHTHNRIHPDQDSTPSSGANV